MNKKKTAAIYDRWLHTLGGGEQVAFGYAEVLRDMGYQVNLLTHAKVDLESAQQKMNVDLNDISLRYIPNLPDSKLGVYTSEYDLFINTSYMDHIPNQASKSILSVFFPARLKLPLHHYLKRAVIIPFLRNFFTYPNMIEGIQDEKIIHNKLHKVIGEETLISFNKPLKKLTITLFFEQLAFSVLDQINFTVLKENKKYDIRINRSINLLTNTVTYHLDFENFDQQQLDTSSKVLITIPDSPYAENIAITSVSAPALRFKLFNLFAQIVPKWENRLHGGPNIVKKDDLKSYSKIVTISQFSQHWIHTYWNLESTVLYPPVSTNEFKPSSNKKNKILHIGRFFVGGHSKKQLQLVKIFKQLVDNGFDDWELHLVGSVAQGAVHQQYLEKIRKEISDYPIKIHLNIPFKELQRQLSEAKIYWHATGLDENENKYPVLLEHFGITTVEAMAAGCVPVVIAKGAQPEIVTEESGFLWKNREELFQFTTKLMQDETLLKKMSKQAQLRSNDFSKQKFKQRLQNIIEEL